MNKINFKDDMIVFVKVVNIQVKANMISFDILRRIEKRKKYLQAYKNKEALKALKLNAHVIQDTFKYNIVKDLKAVEKDDMKAMSHILRKTILRDINCTNKDVAELRSYETQYDIVSFVAYKVNRFDCIANRFKHKFLAHATIKAVKTAKKQTAKKQTAKKQTAKN